MVDFDFILACVIVVRPLMGDAILHMTLNQFQIAVLTILMNHQCEILNKLKVRIIISVIQNQALESNVQF